MQVVVRRGGGRSNQCSSLLSSYQSSFAWQFLRPGYLRRIEAAMSAIDGDVSAFVSIRRVDPRGVECWSSREFAEALGYSDLRNFQAVLDKAKLACLNSGQPVEDHFVDITEMIQVGKGAQRAVSTTLLSRYACYLAIQNADPGKPRVALGQTYFATQTRRQELSDEAIKEQRRLLLREEMRTHNVQLADAARNAGVIEPRDYAIFQNHGYQGLYGGLTAQDIHRRKGLKPSEQILDHMGSAELAANLFRATQAEEKMRRESVVGKANANRTHREVGAKVRQTIQELGGTMPEDLPTAESIKKLEARRKKELGSG
jgi:DNA-damage-inducible protein D